MKLESKKYLSDIDYSIDLIEEFLAEYTFNEYREDIKTKSCITHQGEYYLFEYH